MNKLKVFTCLKKHVFECSVFLKIWCCNCHWIVSVNDDFSVFIQAGLSVWVLSNCRQHTFVTFLQVNSTCYDFSTLHEGCFEYYHILRCLIKVIVSRREIFWLRSAILVVLWWNLSQPFELIIESNSMYLLVVLQQQHFSSW